MFGKKRFSVKFEVFNMRREVRIKSHSYKIIDVRCLARRILKMILIYSTKNVTGRQAKISKKSTSFASNVMGQ